LIAGVPSGFLTTIVKVFVPNLPELPWSVTLPECTSEATELAIDPHKRDCVEPVERGHQEHGIQEEALNRSVVVR
jgi:hypothetical protein